MEEWRQRIASGVQRYHRNRKISGWRVILRDVIHGIGSRREASYASIQSSIIRRACVMDARVVVRTVIVRAREHIIRKQQVETDYLQATRDCLGWISG